MFYDLIIIKHREGNIKSMINSVLSALSKGDKLTPLLHTSVSYKHWVSTKDLKRCTECRELQGKIWLIKEVPDILPPIHFNGRGTIEPLDAIFAGTATIDGMGGADYWLKHYKQLPNNYINKSEAYKLGWKEGKWPSNFIPNKAIIANGIYKNRNGICLKKKEEYGMKQI